MNSGVRVSIIICTRNRAGSLRAALASLALCDIPADLPAELLVIDNGSLDNTREVVENAGLTNMPVRYVFEPRPGKCHALNRGLAECAGDIVLFTDDDVSQPTHWLESMCRPIVLGKAEVVQGKVVCDLPDLPAYYDRAKLGAPGQVDHGDEGVLLSKYELVGADLALERRCVETVGGFNTLLGPGRCGFFDDTELSWRLARAGYRTWYEPHAEVIHRPLSCRITRRSLRREWFRLGVSGFIAASFSPRDARSSGPHLARRILRTLKVMLKQRFFCGDRRMTQDEMFLWMQIGSSWAQYKGLRGVARTLQEPLSQPPRLISLRCTATGHALGTMGARS